MCRIAGIINVSTSSAESKTIVKNMCQVLKHGGPDDEGLFLSPDARTVLGHRRLSLLDLSTAGQQPMTLQDRFTITYNGEIYNFKELRSELQRLGYSFQSTTDTEVILAAFAEWHTNSFKKLDGMFALAIHDKETNQVFLARDAAGIKPLYYYCDKQSLVFASEVRAFEALPGKREQHPHWPIYLMAFGHLPEPHTRFKHIKALPKGSLLKYDISSHAYSVQSFRHYSFSSVNNNHDYTLAQVRQLVEKAVDTHLVSDAPLGVFLSGGIDSGILTKVASQKKGAGLNALSIYFKESDYSEKAYQDLILEGMPGSAQQFELTKAEFEKSLPAVFDAMDMPSCDGINTWFISKYAREAGLKAVLSGIGADELFGGYPSFERMRILNQLKVVPDFLLKKGSNSGVKALKRAAYLQLEGVQADYLFLRGYFSIHEIALQLNATEKEIVSALNEMADVNDIQKLPSKNQASWLEFHMYMQNQLLRDADVMSMAHGLEIRVPFLYHPLIQFMMETEASVKFAGNRPKQLLIDAFKDLLPRPVWDRKKMGFSFPFAQWLSNNSFIEEQLMQAGPGTRKQYQKFKAGELHWSHMLGLLLLSRHGYA